MTETKDQNPYLVSCEPAPDPSAKCNPAERAPLLSDEQMESWVDIGDSMGPVNSVCDFYEAKITSGELRVVEKVTKGYRVRDEYEGCENKACKCPHNSHYNFCPGCGAQIVKP